MQKGLNHKMRQVINCLNRVYPKLEVSYVITGKESKILLDGGNITMYLSDFYSYVVSEDSIALMFTMIDKPIVLYKSIDWLDAGKLDGFIDECKKAQDRYSDYYDETKGIIESLQGRSMVLHNKIEGKLNSI